MSDASAKSEDRLPQKSERDGITIVTTSNELSQSLFPPEIAALIEKQNIADKGNGPKLKEQENRTVQRWITRVDFIKQLREQNERNIANGQGWKTPIEDQIELQSWNEFPSNERARELAKKDMQYDHAKGKPLTKSESRELESWHLFPNDQKKRQLMLSSGDSDLKNHNRTFYDELEQARKDYLPVNRHFNLPVTQ